jgi:signal transduction histidine kinase
MSLSHLYAAGSYWILILMWSGILTFYIFRLGKPKVSSPLFRTLIYILAIDAFRTLFESLYFGAWYTSLAGFISITVHDTLVRPELILVPKVLNIVAAAFVIGILIRWWLPHEEVELERHQEEIDRLEKHGAELGSVNDALQVEVKMRRRMEQSLRRLFESQESERQLVAHEIHDGIAQYAVGAKMMAESLQTDPLAEPIHDRLGALADVLGKSVDEGRRLIAGLRPLILDDEGVVEAIKHLICEHNVEMTIHFDHQGALGDLSLALKNALYRITQESLANARKYSQSDRIEISLKRLNETVNSPSVAEAIADAEEQEADLDQLGAGIASGSLKSLSQSSMDARRVGAKKDLTSTSK